MSYLSKAEGSIFHYFASSIGTVCSTQTTNKLQKFSTKFSIRVHCTFIVLFLVLVLNLVLNLAQLLKSDVGLPL